MAKQATSAIITCAPTGAIHTPTMSPALPITPEQIAEAALGAAAAGAAIVHLHVRDPQDGHPVQDPGLFKEVLAIVKDRSDVVINLTTGGSPHMTVDERIAPAVQLAPELASLNMGSMNFGLFPMLDRYPELPARVGAGAAGRQGRRLQEHLRRHRADPEALRRPGHPVRVRVLRHRAPVQPREHARPRPGPPAAVRPDRVRPARRHRRRLRGPRPHASDGAPAVRRGLRVVGAGCRLRADAAGHDRPVARRQRAGRAGGLAVGRPRASSRSPTPPRSSGSPPSPGCCTARSPLRRRRRRRLDLRESTSR